MNLLQLMNDVKEEQQKNARINSKFAFVSLKTKDKVSLKKTYAFEQAYSRFHDQLNGICLLNELRHNNPNKFFKMVARFEEDDSIPLSYANLVLIVDDKEYILNSTTMIKGCEEHPFENDDWLLIYLNSRRTKEGLVYTNLEQSKEFIMPAMVEHAIESYAKRYEIDPKDPTRVYMHSKEKDGRYL